MCPLASEGIKQKDIKFKLSEVRNCVKVVPNKPHGFCGRKATLNQFKQSELRICVKVDVAVLGSPSLISLVVSVDVKRH